jgi:hypothetical protein
VAVPIDEALTIFDPQPDALLRRISAHIDDGMLAEIAEADYGMDRAAHLVALRRIRDDGEMAVPLPWEPKEVLQLIRWSQPDDPIWQPSGRGDRGHWMRAFACAALLRAAGEPANRDYMEGHNQTLILLVWSLDALDAALERDAACFLVWLIGRIAAERAPPGVAEWSDEDTAFFGVGLIWFGLKSRPVMPDGAIVALAEWICDCERRHNARHNSDYGLSPGRWLLSTTYHDLCHAHWKRLGSAMLALDLSARSPAARDWIELIGSLLAEE